MASTIVALFDDYADAQQAIRELETAGVKTGDISLIANNAANRYDTYPDHPSTAWPIVPRKPPPVQVPQSARRWVGGVGLLTGLGIMAIPGVGPV